MFVSIFHLCIKKALCSSFGFSLYLSGLFPFLCLPASISFFASAFRIVVSIPLSLSFFFFNHLFFNQSVSFCPVLSVSLTVFCFFTVSTFLFTPFLSHCVFQFLSQLPFSLFHLSFCVSNLLISLLVSLSVSLLHVATYITLFEHVSLWVSL